MTYTLNSVGPLNFATLLHAPRKGETLHAIVSRRRHNELVLLAFVMVEEASEGKYSFKTFFAMEAQLNKAHHADPTQSGVQIDKTATPTKKQKEAMEASRRLATPEPWVKRSRCE